ncbi:kelch-like protein 23 [Arctopsyche grandis]|uniref:kelch-like protein 23 n=1 Tax=Arctopsyche grandis TaxID=121162 RepID=UPI00406D6D86
MTSLTQAIVARTSLNSKSFIPSETPRGKREKIALVGGPGLDVANTIDIYDGENESWALFNIKFNKYEFASVVVGHWMFIIGGLNSSHQAVTSVEYVDLKHGQKYPLKPLNQSRSDLSAVSLRCDSSTDIYAIGGDESCKSVERWNSKTGDWEIIASLLLAVDDHRASVIDDKIYVTGGQISENGDRICTNKVQMYSVESNSWIYRAQMIQGRDKHSSVVFKGKLFVAGGYQAQTFTALDSVEHYDPVANLWTEFTKLPAPAFGINFCVFQNKILCMGGYSSNVWEYDETRRTLKASKILSKARSFSVAHVIPYDSII